ncbi:MAG: N-acetyltransferase [Phreatobacter sp.]|uniref:GNAT family N-acetyltransferase n=1 Tax=Phreatobacter sp. TaxID=1966341 RepID=UPI00273628AD|nr:N-acetyltransferase [Phreatobacter sp.]MDP2803145.1 N-acetyltransferase [Phreatobacter sp.]
MTVHVSPDRNEPAVADPIVVRDEAMRHLSAREVLLDAAFGADRCAKTSERLREGRLPADRLALVAEAGEHLVGTVRLWNVTLGPGRPALLLGPLAVDGAIRSSGIGGLLMREATSRARDEGHRAIILVGDEPYYRRFGFAVAKMERLWMPGPVERSRFLGLELVPGALDGARGLVSPTGGEVPRWQGLELAGAWRRAA